MLFCLVMDSVEWNGSSTGRIENGFHYDYMGLSYIYEKQFTRKIILGLEPFANIDFTQDRIGLDVLSMPSIT